MVELQLNNPNEVPFKSADTNKLSYSNPNKTRRGKDLVNHSGHPSNKDKAIITNNPSLQMNSEDLAKTRKGKNKALDNPKDEPEIELNLKRPRVAKDIGKAIETDHNVSRHSDLSAISRYICIQRP